MNLFSSNSWSYFPLFKYEKCLKVDWISRVWAKTPPHLQVSAQLFNRPPNPESVNPPTPIVLYLLSSGPQRPRCSGFVKKAVITFPVGVNQPVEAPCRSRWVIYMGSWLITGLMTPSRLVLPFIQGLIHLHEDVRSKTCFKTGLQIQFTREFTFLAQECFIKHLRKKIRFTNVV